MLKENVKSIQDIKKYVAQAGMFVESVGDGQYIRIETQPFNFELKCMLYSGVELIKNLSEKEVENILF